MFSLPVVGYTYRTGFKDLTSHTRKGLLALIIPKGMPVLQLLGDLKDFVPQGDSIRIVVEFCTVPYQVSRC